MWRFIVGLLATVGTLTLIAIGGIAAFVASGPFASKPLAPPIVLSIDLRDVPSESRSTGRAVAGPGYGGDGLRQLVGRNSEVDDLAALRPRQRHGGVAVRVDDLAKSRLRARHHEFVAGRQHRNLGPAVGGDRGMVHRRGERQVAVGEPSAVFEQHRVAGKIEARNAHMPSRAGRGGHQ